MEVKKGYKYTEVGIIPEDWDVVTYGEAFDFLSTASYSRDKLSDNKEVKYVHYGDIHTKWEHFLDFKESELPTIENELCKNYHFINDGDLIMVDASEDYEGVGKSVEVKNIGNKKAIAGLHTFLMRDKNKVFIDGFRGYIHSNDLVKSSLYKLATGLKVYGVSKNNLKKIIIPLPKKPEQTAIANALNDINTLINNLEKLIEKKKAIKQGAMQELLTGKKRLQGFEKKWKEIKLKETGEIITGSTPPTGIKEYWNGNIPWVTPTDITDKKYIYNTEREITQQGLSYCRQVPKGSVLVTCIASIGKNCIFRKDGSCNQQINAIIPSDDFSVEFIYYLMEYSKQFLIANAGITATNIISKKIFSELIFSLPLLEEQIVITRILSDMDEEIEVLEKKLDKYRMIKKAMMQELLTGKTRLV